jgi:hypothetical protein
VSKYDTMAFPSKKKSGGPGTTLIHIPYAGYEDVFDAQDCIFDSSLLYCIKNAPLTGVEFIIFQ